MLEPLRLLVVAGVFEEGLDDHLLHFLVVGHGVEHRGQQFLEDAPQAAGAGLVLEGDFGDLLEHRRLDLQFHPLALQQQAELVVEGVLRLGHDPHQHGLGEVLEAGHHRQAAGEFGDQAEFEEVGGLHPAVEAVQDVLVVVLAGADVAEAVALLHDLLQADEGAAADEEDARGVDAAVVRQPHRIAFHDLQQGVLHALAGSGLDPGRFPGAGLELVDLVDEDDAAPGPLRVAAGLFQQAQQDGLDLLADVLGLGQGGGVGGDEGHLQEAGEGLAQQGLAGAGGADDEDVALVQAHRLAGGGELAVVGVDRHRQHALGLFLADDVLVEVFDDGAGGGVLGQHGGICQKGG